MAMESSQSGGGGDTKDGEDSELKTREVEDCDTASTRGYEDD